VLFFLVGLDFLFLRHEDFSAPQVLHLTLFLLLVVLLAPISSYFSCADFVPTVVFSAAARTAPGPIFLGFVVLQSNPATATSFGSPGSVVASRASRSQSRPLFSAALISLAHRVRRISSARSHGVAATGLPARESEHVDRR
jgi:hypothetical protein